MRHISLAEYNPEWLRMFTAEAAEIAAALGDCLVETHHIGSTSVQALPAKPVIDIMLEVTSLGALDDHTAQLMALGYRPRGENGIPGRRYFTKGEQNRSHQLHAFITGDGQILRHLAFRDYLRHNPVVRNQYAQVKREAIKNCGNIISQYCSLKEPFIQYYEVIAVKWYNSQRKS